MSINELAKDYLEKQRNLKIAELEFKEAERKLCETLHMDCGRLDESAAKLFENRTVIIDKLCQATHYLGNSPVVQWDFLRSILQQEVLTQAQKRVYWTSVKVTKF